MGEDNANNKGQELKTWTQIPKQHCPALTGEAGSKGFTAVISVNTPSAETTAVRGSKHLIESVNEGWNNCIPVARIGRETGLTS